MASSTLYTYPDNFRAYKALIAAQYSGAKIKVDPNFVLGETNKSEEFLKKFPLGKVPALETSDGQYLTESNAIAYYVANNQLRGQTDLEKAQIVQWLSFADSEILPASCSWVFPFLGIIHYNKQTIERAKQDVKQLLNSLNEHLLLRTYLVGERISLADISVACTLLHLYQYVLDSQFREPYQNVNRWFTTIINQPQVKNVIGEIKICEQVAQIDPKKFHETQKQSQGQKPAGEKSEGKKEKKEKKKLVEEPELVDIDLIETPKPKEDEFSKLPKGSFDMDDFKRCYSNEAESVSIPYFWQKFDKENYSIWFCEYKYCDELKKVFMSCNLIAGMFQRLDKMRKYGFASMCLFGTDNDNTISGVWVWRGQGLAFDLSPDLQTDCESYAWNKLDPDSESTKKLVEQYFSWTGTDKDGRKINQGKIFK